MAQEGNNARRCGQIGEGEDDELSMVDVLNEQARLQADANAVLGGSDANNCTYPQGYLKRQALYACATCTPEGNAGICLACSYACHEGHDLYELYTKRFFTCDCGNEKFSGKECKLSQEKKGLNARNRYNQNFRGLYCTCSRPYPDPDDAVEDEMIQCILCEDWYHGRHLKTALPDSDDFQEMTCPGCMSRYSFLWAYQVTSPVVSVKEAETSEITEDVDVGTSSESQKLTSAAKKTPVEDSDVNENVKTTSSPSKTAISESTNDETNKYSQSDSLGMNNKREHSENESEGPSPKKVKLEEQETKPEPANGEQHEQTSEQEQNEQTSGQDVKECVLKSLQRRVIDHPDHAAFWPEGWRTKLCQCADCLDMYKDKEIEFLLDEADTVHAYEAKGHDAENSGLEEQTEASMLAGMNRVQQIEVVRGFMDLKSELNEFLHGFAREGKVVTETDIREFFQRMDQRKRERMHIPQHSCR